MRKCFQRTAETPEYTWFTQCVHLTSQHCHVQLFTKKVEQRWKMYLKQKCLGFRSPLFGPIELPLTLPVNKKHSDRHPFRVSREQSAPRTAYIYWTCERSLALPIKASPDILPLLKSGKQARVQNIFLRLPSAVSVN